MKALIINSLIYIYISSNKYPLTGSKRTKQRKNFIIPKCRTQSNSNIACKRILTFYSTTEPKTETISRITFVCVWKPLFWYYCIIAFMPHVP